MAAYQERCVDDELDQVIAHLPAISLEGPRGVGKTATAMRRAATTLAMDDPAAAAGLSANPTMLDHLPEPILIDEWQRFGRSWDLVRRAVDRDAHGGRFLLTGSAIPSELPSHSGAGRITTLRMRPFSFVERYPGIGGRVSLASLASGDSVEVGAETAIGFADYIREIVASGFPAIRGLPEPARGLALDGYLARISERDFGEQGHVVRRPRALRGWMSAYAAATSTTATFEQIRDSATAGEVSKPAKSTVDSYRNTLSQLWILDELPGWLPFRGSLGRLASSPKHHLADPALACRLTGVTEESLLRSAERGPWGVTTGAMFESLVTQSLQVYAQKSGFRLAHLRTWKGAQEVDLIAERADGRVVAIEVKLAAEVTDTDVRHLRWLREKMGTDVLDAVVVTTGQFAYRRADGIAVIPLALLSP